MRGAALLLVVVIAACSDGPVVGAAPLPRPQALVDCAQAPDDLQARLWVSGSDEPCFLVVDDAGAAGRCAVAPGIERRVTLDWFIDRGGQDVVLAQAQRELDLTGAQADESVAFVDADYATDACKDMSADSFAGADTVVIDGQDRPVCDLDDDAASNVSEVCIGADPLGGL